MRDQMSEALERDAVRVPDERPDRLSEGDDLGHDPILHGNATRRFMIPAMHPWDAIWIFFILSSLQPVVQKQLLAAARRRMLARIASRRKATVITLIHRQETISFLGFPLMRHIDIDD